MEEAARKRKEKLLALKNGGKLPVEEKTETAEEVTKENTKTNKRPLEDSADESRQKPQTVETVAEEIEEEVKKKAAELQTEEIDLSSLVPRKVDWDLKRDIESKLEKLERQTQRKIVELIKIRVNSSSEGSQLADSVLADRLGTKKNVARNGDSDSE